MVAPLIYTAVLPFLLAGLVLGALLLARRTFELKITERRAAALGAVGLGVAYLVCHPGVRGGTPSVPPTDATDWPWVLSGIALLLGALEALCGRIAPLRWVVRIGLVTVSVSLLAEAHLENVYADAPGGWLALSIMGLAILLYMAQLDGLAVRSAQSPALFALVVSVSASAGVAVLGQSAVLGQLCGVLAAALAGQLALVWLRPALAPLRGTVLVLGLTHGLLILSCYLYAELPASSALILALAPGAVWLGTAGPLERLSKGKSLAVSLLLVVIVNGAAAGIAHSAAPESYDPYATGAEDW